MNALAIPQPALSATERAPWAQPLPRTRGAMLICPSARPAVGVLAELMPLTNVPILGQGLVEYWLSHLARSGIKDVLILASDRPEEVRALTGSGARWGLAIQVQAAPIEFTASDAIAKYEEEPSAPIETVSAWGSSVREQPAPEGAEIRVAELDHLPGLSRFHLFASYRDWYAAACAWIPFAKSSDRVGVREVRSGIWMSLPSHVLTKDLRAPCWVGKNVFVGEGAVIGPGTILEDGVFIEPGAVVAHSYVGPDTYVGRDAEVLQSVAWGSTLVDWSTGVLTRVPDAFILSSLKRPRSRGQIAALFDRITRLYSVETQKTEGRGH